MSKAMMYELFTECEELGIKVYMSNVDSILIPTSDVHKLHHRLDDEMGDLKLECSSDQAIVVRANLFYMNDDYYRSSGIPHKTIEATGDVRLWFLNRLNQK
jgi:hypothetical protein